MHGCTDVPRWEWNLSHTEEIVVVWDNASYHNSKELNLKLEEVENLRRVQLTYLPPYSPDKNPRRRFDAEKKG